MHPQIHTITCRQPEQLSTAMIARRAALVHSAEVGYDNATELSRLHWCTRLIDDFDQNVTLRNMVVPPFVGTRYGKHRKL